MKLRAVLLNCTLKRSPAVSNTEALMRRVMEWYDRLDVESELIRVVDHDVRFGVTSDEGGGDQWPLILDRVRAADILVMGMPIWFGVRSSVAQMVIERLDGTYAERNVAGQYPLYNKVAGVVVTGNEDGAHDCAGTTLFNLSHLGCAIPPNADTYWVGDAGPGPSYIEAGGESHPYTQRTTRWMAHNTVHLARILRSSPIPAEGNTFAEDTEHPHVG
jgi:multimeric flavodoxin WrbA